MVKVIEPGHIYLLHTLDEAPENVNAGLELVFVNREPGHEHPGTQTQEVLRALIDRTYHCHACQPSPENAAIIHHLRMALVYHEARALVTKAEKGKYRPDHVQIGSDGHFRLDEPNNMVAIDPGLASHPDLGAPEPRIPCRYRDYDVIK